MAYCIRNATKDGVATVESLEEGARYVGLEIRNPDKRAELAEEGAASYGWLTVETVRTPPAP